MYAKPHVRISSDPGDRSLAVETDEVLWKCHERLMAQVKKEKQCTETGDRLFDIKIEIARRMMRSCTLCERRCCVDRFSGERGFCQVGARSHYFAESVSYSEELTLIPSYTIYFNGCNFRCPYCNTREDNSWLPDSGEEVQVEKLSNDILSREGEINNVSFLGGEPTPHLLTVLCIARAINGEVPIVWDSNMYFSVQALRLLDGAIPIYLGNFRYGNDECALRYSRAKDYTRIVERNLLLAKKSARLIVRYLLLPGHFECCFLPVTEWLNENLPGIEFSLFSQYVPYPEMKGFDEIGRRITSEEMKRARNTAQEKGLNLVG